MQGHIADITMMKAIDNIAAGKPVEAVLDKAAQEHLYECEQCMFHLWDGFSTRQNMLEQEYAMPLANKIKIKLADIASAFRIETVQGLVMPGFATAAAGIRASEAKSSSEELKTGAGFFIHHPERPGVAFECSVTTSDRGSGLKISIKQRKDETTHQELYGFEVLQTSVSGGKTPEKAEVPDRERIWPLKIADPVVFETYEKEVQIYAIPEAEESAAGLILSISL